MNVWDIVKKVGAGVLSSVVPGGGVILEVINQMLPSDKKLPVNATGDQVGAAIHGLPADKQAELMSKQFDVDITEIKESHSTVRMMLESDAKNPHSTRPYIAKGAFHVVAFAIVTAMLIWAYGVLIESSELVKTVMDGWPFVLALIAPLVVLLQAYFGVLKHEHKNRLDAAGGNATTPTGIVGILSTVLNR